MLHYFLDVVFNLFSICGCVWFFPACDCNGLSNRCKFDEELYRRTGHGGHCEDCRENTFGTNCERCRDNYYRRTAAEKCKPCNCHPIGKVFPKSSFDFNSDLEFCSHLPRQKAVSGIHPLDDTSRIFL